MRFIRTLHQVDHPVCTHMSTSVQVHLQYITFTYLVLHLKVLENILKLSKDQWNPTLFDIFKHACLDFLLVEYLDFRIREVFISPGVSRSFYWRNEMSLAVVIGLEKGGQKSEERSYMDQLWRLGVPGPKKARVLEEKREEVVSTGP